MDKKSVMTYVMCMYQVLPHDDDVADQLVIEDNCEPTAAAVNSAAANSCQIGKKSSPMKSASPLKVPPKVVTKGRPIVLFQISIFTRLSTHVVCT